MAVIKFLQVGKMDLFQHQQIVRVTFDFAITFAFDSGAELRLETDFAILDDGSEHRVEPISYVKNAEMIVSMLNQTVLCANVSDKGILLLTLGIHRAIKAIPSQEFEAWSYSENGTRKIVCMPGGELAMWS